jgi:hypothetical protein
MVSMYTQRLASLALAVAASFTWTYAEAGCVDLWTRRLSDAQGIRRSEFRPGEQFVVCFRFPEDSFVSLWDVPPRGDASRLFPNLLTHRENNATIRAAQLAGSQEHCYGTPDTFPLYFPAEQGRGEGKLSLHVTAALDDQPTQSDFTVPGQRALRASIITPKAARADETQCGPKVIAYFEYKIAR